MCARGNEKVSNILSFTKWRLKIFVKFYETRQRGFVILIKENILAIRKLKI